MFSYLNKYTMAKKIHVCLLLAKLHVHKHKSLNKLLYWYHQNQQRNKKNL